MSSDLEIGSVIGDKYRLDAILGEGGFGVVYRATTVETGRLVALKVLKPEVSKFGPTPERFRRELRAIARLESPHVPRLYDYGQTPDGTMYMVTEYVDGEDLADLLLRRLRLEEDEARHILVQVLLSLDDAHRSGVLHRDIKPANIRVFTQEGDPLRVKVLDFGIAKLMDDGTPNITRTGVVLGTPRYLAPEVIYGEPPSPASDLYSLGLVARELLLGRASTETTGFQPEDVSRDITAADPVSPEFAAVVNRLLARDVHTRFASAAAALAALRDIQRAGDAVTTRFPVVDETRLADPPGGEQPTRLWRPPAGASHSAPAARPPGDTGRLIGIVLVAVLVILAGVALFFVASAPS